MLEAYPWLGKSLFPRNTWRQSVVGDEFTFIGPDPEGELGYADETKARLGDVARVRHNKTG